jgi:hypothetical protein
VLRTIGETTRLGESYAKLPVFIQRELCIKETHTLHLRASDHLVPEDRSLREISGNHLLGNIPGWDLISWLAPRPRLKPIGIHVAHIGASDVGIGIGPKRVEINFNLVREKAVVTVEIG